MAYALVCLNAGHGVSPCTSLTRQYGRLMSGTITFIVPSYSATLYSAKGKQRHPSFFCMQTNNPHELVHLLGLCQRQAGVDKEVANLVCAYARLQADRGRDIEFYAGNEADAKAGNDLLVRELAAKNPDAETRFIAFLRKYSRCLAARRLPVIFNAGHLAEKLRVSEAFLRRLAFNQGQFYRFFEIPKSNGQPRQIAAPQGKLISIQKWILGHILKRGKPHHCAKAFIKGLSIVDNAKPHKNRKVVTRLDLKDFFPSITHRQVRKEFEHLGYPYHVALVLANLCTLRGALPQGAPTSPALSNLVCMRLDKRLAGLGKKMHFRYTRYADDLVFSSNNRNFPKLIPFLKEIVQQEGFVVNEGKLAVMRSGSRQQVTGLVINKKVGIPRERRRWLRAVAHRLRTRGPETIEIKSQRHTHSDPIKVFSGHVAYAGMVDESYGNKIKSEAT